MRVTRAQAEENRRKVIEVASRLFRERGFDGVGLNEVMAAAGLTHGAFYKQFASKDALIAEACEYALDQGAEHWKRTAGEAGDAAFGALVGRYLAPAHRDRPAQGCVFAALAADAARYGSEQLPKSFEAGMKAYVDVIAEAMAGAGTEAGKDAALVAVSTMVGALLLARTVDDDAYSRRILDAARASLLGDAAGRD